MKKCLLTLFFLITVKSVMPQLVATQQQVMTPGRTDTLRHKLMQVTFTTLPVLISEPLINARKPEISNEIKFTIMKNNFMALLLL